MKASHCLPVLAFSLFTCQLSTALAQGTAFTYQGRLNDSGAPASGAYDLRFAIYDSAANGTAVGNPLTNSATLVSNGLFVAQLDFGAGIFNGSARWLEIGVRTNGSTGIFATLSPRQQLTATPYAIQSANAASALVAASANAVSATNISGTLALAQLPGVVVTNNNTGSVVLNGSFSGNGAGLTNLNAATLNGLAANSFWQLGGNNVASGQFIGSTNSQAVEIWAKTRALRLEPNASGAPNVIGGAPNNFVSGAVGATVGGGGALSYSIFNFAFSNRVTADFGTVSGGRNNVAASSDATVGGGYANSASGVGATVSGGGYDGTTVAGNTASGGGAAIGGGNANTASGLLSVVSGGNNNRATNAFSTVPGGQFNTAGGAQSFAAGRKALATHDGAFVWADTTDAYFGSAAKDSFNVRANGGARFVTGGAGMTVDGQPVVTANNTFQWQIVSGTTQQAQPNTGYITTNNSLVTLTLPSSANLGDVTRVSGNGAGGWKIAQNAGQTVYAQSLSGNIGLAWTGGHASSQNWQCVASSGDGTKLVAGVNNGLLYVSRDSGVVWGSPDSTARWWSAAAFSADGTKLVAAVYGGQIYTSSDSGATLTAQNSGNQFWYCVASSADGTKLVAGVRNGQIYTSSDSGVSWTAQNSGTQLWYSVASSADGTKLVGVPNGGQISTSSNSGVTWTAQNSGSRNWYSVASSTDGTKLVAVVNSGQIYTSSDSGVTWTARATTQSWQSVASSADGTKLVAVVSGGQIYTSHDSGVTWNVVPDSFIRNWYSVASSADGTKLVAVINGGPIFTSVPSSVSSTTAGATGYLLGNPNSALELQFLGNGQFLPVSHEGIIQAF